MEIKCKKITCGFNNSTVCMAKEISVDSSQGCRSFTKRSKERAIKRNQKENRFEAGGELNDYVYCPNKTVNCNCIDCKFNENRECSCNGITLNGGERTGVCVSHIKK